MNTSSVKGFWHGAFLLTAVALFMKVLSVGYRIPYQNIAGDIGFYVYQQIYPFYSITIILATYGFPVIVSKLVSEKVANNEYEKAEEISRYSFITLVVFGGLGFIFLFYGAPLLAGLMGDSDLTVPLKATSFSFLLMPGIASIRGYFQGNENVLPTAWSQVTEQSVRVAAILVISITLVMNGYNAYATGTGAAIGSLIGGLSALFLLVVLRLKQPNRKSVSINIAQLVYVGRRLLSEGTLICVSVLIMVLFQLMDALTIVPALGEYGLSAYHAKETKGIFDRGQPLIQVGTVLATSLSLSIVPVIVKAVSQENLQLIREKTGLALKISFVTGASASVGLALIMRETNTMLFTDDSLSVTLSILTGAILFGAIAMTAAGILQGLGQERLAARYTIIGVMIKGLGNVVLVPVIGINGAALSSVLGFFVVAALATRTVHAQVGLETYAFRFWRFLFALAVMSGAVGLLCFIMPSSDSRLLSSITALSGATIGVIVLSLTVIWIRVFTKAELLQFPKGEKLISLQQKFSKGA
ncbi:putative polysaccharide biosynthesis protein [Alkalihalobacillus sp. CinArs1]|uniref:putative polysaccharide biosynthesis protein n=1 Tax=Alkalihalobacillus sp. CinArs1 TaxID=2995314 RepID=UPI0022DDDE78|nr:polysaccharide biosynthesis protein [Alkalihalobacillus sp. CinArs1]